MATTPTFSAEATRLVQSAKELNELASLATPWSWYKLMWAIVETGYVPDLRQLPDLPADDPKNRARALLVEVLEAMGNDYKVLK
jgi:hypothetical protein